MFANFVKILTRFWLCFPWQLWHCWTFHSAFRSVGFWWELDHIPVNIIDWWTTTRWPSSLHPWTKWNKNTKRPHRSERTVIPVFGQTKAYHAVRRSSSIHACTLCLSPCSTRTGTCNGFMGFSSCLRAAPAKVHKFLWHVRIFQPCSSQQRKSYRRPAAAGRPELCDTCYQSAAWHCCSRFSGAHKSRHYCFCCFVLSKLPMVVSPTSDLTMLQSKQHKDFSHLISPRI